MIKGIKGPAVQSLLSKGQEIDLPNCVKIKSQKDNDEFSDFIGAVIRATRENALDEIASYVEEQNGAMTRLVKKLGA